MAGLATDSKMGKAGKDISSVGVGVCGSNFYMALIAGIKSAW